MRGWILPGPGKLVLPVFTLLMLASGLEAAAVTLDQLPPSGYADTEVSTNLPVTVDFAVMSRMEFRLSLVATPSNCVEVAIGCDADADGDLGLDERDCTFGYRCGKWFQRDAVADTETETADPRPGRIEGAFRLKRRRMNESWNLIKVTRRGSAPVDEGAVIESWKPGDVMIIR